MDHIWKNWLKVGGPRCRIYSQIIVVVAICELVAFNRNKEASLLY